MEEKTPQFNGIFNDHFRKALREFRESRGLTYQELALRLHCNWSTICKWETGKTSKCAGIMFTMLKHLFDGELDNWLLRDELDQLKRMNDFLNVLILRKQIANRYYVSRHTHSRNLPFAIKRPEFLPFSGSFALKHIQRLVWLQTISRLSDEDFSQVIGCSILTLRNWKKGRSTSCQTRFVIPLRLLFKGELDEKLILFHQAK